MYRAEEPHVVESGKTLYGLACKIADWVVDAARLRSNGAWIAGVYGARGSGKTSLLWTVYEILAQRSREAKSRGEPVSYVLPEVQCALDAMFTPAATRTHDDILFMLLDHLQVYERPAQSRNEFSQARDEARNAEVRRKDLARFLQYEQEIATSSQDVPRRLVKAHEEAARTTSILRKAFTAILSSLRKPDEIVPIFIDDLDLQPQRALEVLEILYLFMNVRGVVVLIAADKDLLVRSIELALKSKERNVHHPGLASALLAKYMPHEWLLSTPSEQERIDLLFGEGGSTEDSEFAKWWQVDALQGLREARAERRRDLQRERDRRGEQIDDARPDDQAENPIPETVRMMIGQSLAPLAPVTYRGLKALHNRLIGWRERLGAARSNEIAPEFRREMGRYKSLGLNRYLLSPFLTMMAALDVRWPELELLGSLERSPAAVARALSALVAIDVPPQREHAPGLRASTTIARDSDRYEILSGERPEDLPVLGVLLQKSRFTGGDLGEAKRSLRVLARTWKDWQQRGVGVGVGVVTQERFLPISIISSALEESRRFWGSIFLAKEVEDWHLDLRSIVHHESPQPMEIRQAREESRLFLRQKQIASYQGRLEIFTRVPLSFLIWLGWALDRQQSIVVYNAETGTPFEGPAEPLRFPDRGGYETADVAFAPPAEGNTSEPGSTIAIVDLTSDHKSNAGHLDRLFRDGVRVDCPDRCLITRRSSELIVQADLIPVLNDILELIGQLRRERGIHHLHLAFAGPDVVAFFLGRQLKAQGMRISLYELYGDHHEWVFDLEERAPESA